MPSFMSGKLNSRKIIFFSLVLMTAAGFFLRAYHFPQWLHFELDQSRDAMVIDDALSGGPGELTLLGPKAAGTLLRLGPAFYYLQYLGGLVFGRTPWGIAYPTMIFSILAIPLLYFFLRRLFSRRTSLAVSAVSAVSLYLVIYGRFAWNPNSIPFFAILAFYGLLRAVDDNEAHRTKWFLISSAALGIATHLHFLAFLTLPLAAAVFVAIKRPKLKLKAWLGAFFIILFLYVPVILNDIKTHGANTEQFFKAVMQKSGREAEHNLAEKIIRAYSELSRGTFLILSGQEQTEIPGVVLNPGDGTLMALRCDESCAQTWEWGAAALVFFTAGLILSMIRFFQEKQVWRRDFLLLSGIWTAAVAGIFVPLAYDVAPRFFLLLVPVAFVLLGVVLDFIGEIVGNRKAVLAVSVAVLVAMNLLGVRTRFDQLARAATENVDIGPDRILKERTRVTVEQEIMIADYMKSFHRENGWTMYVASESQYLRAVTYHFRSDNIAYMDFPGSSVYRKGNYFLVFVTNSSFDKKAGKYLDRFDIAEKKPFGTLTVARLTPKENRITAEEQLVKPRGGSNGTKTVYPPGVPVRYTWSEIFENGIGVLDDKVDE